ncbi:MAG: hypothetical protein A3D96_05050 [Chlamydiae bacterium RIFCSPHIGHO2_12_FULL_44_59]|nr:MAG: hypothetical protein A2796_03285 [Chlamydiae bacterium RIFCSPHIGHO2_01_FULL_44_39]OGN58809.1 MAG: hypothetical protein A3C42_01895 [Chlamydiae bacterium RIFCSPHIGHO2_02_FULL_45_9]OGN60188.1 MAG: hypothetical protein A3D96_05050 [Chlamydiae bacterium RIFCSPHIGHO2_12_FULL_44_59]OGN67159.1 MAG: hypothetical protein A2978_00990 [Chlamydiae bacterium RIFCSPLOWO2_01_FULL_44_52]OGN67749.1 MAG: hypothetical protein A3I67_04925 [Chlamydiae bacterium RIFCSPLOWO2_02_FULL_45_22]OGN71452.1 MAG: hyp
MWKQSWKFGVLIAMAVLIFLWLIKAPIMSSYFTKKLGVPITMRTISMWPSISTIRYFRIANPHGFPSKAAFEVQKISIHYSWGRLTSQPSVIDLIEMQDVELTVNLRNLTGSDNNWAAIGAAMPKSRVSRREFIIRKLILRNMTVKVTGKLPATLGVAGTQHFDQMEFENISSKEGFPTKELVRRIFHGAGLQKLLEYFLNPTDTIKEALNPFHIFGQRDKPPGIPEALGKD